jgi:chromate transport protein ChrA
MCCFDAISAYIGAISYAQREYRDVSCRPCTIVAEDSFLVFLRLRLTSFGGSAAHLGYVRNEFVERRRWLNENMFSDLVWLCQFLVGPDSSQVGFASGRLRGGVAGVVAD